MDLIIALNKKKKDWTKKYHKIIQGLETIIDIQLKIQNITKLADTANNQLVDIEIILLKIGETYRIQISEDIYSISEKLRNIIHEDIEQQTYHIQVLLANELNQYKNKGEERIDENIRVLQKSISKNILRHFITNDWW